MTGTQSDTYVSTTGSDTGTCPSTQPCATIQYAEGQTAAGGTIHVANGTYNQSADLTQPLTLEGQSESGVIIDGTNVDYTSLGYYGLLFVNNTSGAAGTITITDMTVTNPYITSEEQSLDQEPIDVANYDQQTGDTVQVTHVTLGPAEDETDFPSAGYYSLNAVSTSLVSNDSASGMYQGYFAEGTGGPSTFDNDVATDLAPNTFGTTTTYYPVGVWALADTAGSQSATASRDSFSGYPGWGIVGEAGYSNGNCSGGVCTGGLTITASHNVFHLTAAAAGNGVSAIQAYAAHKDVLKAHFRYSSGTVQRPDQTVTVVNHGGRVHVSDTHNTIRVIKA